MKKDNAIISHPGPFGPFPERVRHHVDREQLQGLADSMEWMLKNILFTVPQHEQLTPKTEAALNQYRDLCMIIEKDPKLL